jgi:aminoglycoside phosphotransferase (APT) family kinase protein
MHEGQQGLDVATVTMLVAAHVPQLRGRPVRALAASGTVNAIFRIGEGHTARFPLVPGEPASTLAWLQSEAAAARELLGRTRFATPEPVAVVGATAEHPQPWSVQTWLPGTDATRVDAAGSAGLAVHLATLISELRAISTRGRAFTGDGRGGELPDHDAWVHECLDRSAGLVDVARLGALWADLRTRPRRGPDLMSHTDLIPGNLLVDGGRLVGVLDVGGFAPADPALDLVCAWHVLDRRTRRVLRAELGCDDVEWDRGRAWALQQALGLVWYYERTNPVMARTGRRTLEQLLADA